MENSDIYDLVLKFYIITESITKFDPANGNGTYEYYSFIVNKTERSTRFTSLHSDVVQDI